MVLSLGGKRCRNAIRKQHHRSRQLSRMAHDRRMRPHRGEPQFTVCELGPNLSACGSAALQISMTGEVLSSHFGRSDRDPGQRYFTATTGWWGGVATVL